MTRFFAPLVVLALAIHPALAQDAAPQPAQTLELNAMQPGPTGCRVSFLATNTLGNALDRAAVEMAIFASDGGIDRIVTLDFKALTAGKTKVLQFELADLACDGIGRILINDITACQGPGIAATACLDGLVTRSRPDVSFGI